jgi:hypothetical protein
MAVFFPLSVWCADMQGAILNVSNSALVNGTGVTRSTAIFIGDKLQVPANGHAFLSLAGTSVLIAPGSALTFQGTALSLEPDSGLAVSTNTGLSIEAGELTISPAHKEGKFQVARADGTILVAAKLGSVSIFDGSSTTTVAEALPLSPIPARRDPARPPARPREFPPPEEGKLQQYSFCSVSLVRPPLSCLRPQDLLLFHRPAHRKHSTIPGSRR